MLIGRCTACSAETNYPVHLGGLKVWCRSCGNGWVQVQQELSKAAATPVVPPPVHPSTSIPAILSKPEAIPPRHPLSEPHPASESTPAPPPPVASAPIELPPAYEPKTGGWFRLAGWVCLMLTVPVLMLGVWQILKSSDDLISGDAGAIGGFCGSLLPGGALAIITLYLFRRGRG
jgi:hypothetical protein